MFRGLSTDQAPPFEVVYRFFLLAPLFLVVAGLIIFFGDSDIVLSRHSYLSISIIHLFTMGYMSMIMIGASMQFLPVIIGAVYKNPIKITKIMTSSLILFLIFFVGGFLSGVNQLFFYASETIFVAILFFVFITYTIIKATKSDDLTSIFIKMAFILFLFGAILGVKLLSSFGNNDFAQSHFDISFAHLIIMFFGWGLFFVIGVSIKVIPMFWVSSDYEKAQIKILKYLLYSLFILSIINIFVSNSYLQIIALSNLAIVLLTFSYTTFIKLKNRKRKVSDISVELWQTSMKWLFIGAVLILINIFVDIPSPLFAVVFGYGFIVSLTIGMLYKIIPFLSWWHSSTMLAQKGIFTVPTIRDMIASKDLQAQKKLHYLTLLFLVVGIGVGFMLKIAGLLVIISNLYLYKNFLSAINSYKKLIDI